MQDFLPICASRITSEEPVKIKTKGVEDSLDYLATRVFSAIYPYLRLNLTDAENESVQLKIRLIMRQVKKIKLDVPGKDPSR